MKQFTPLTEIEAGLRLTSDHLNAVSDALAATIVKLNALLQKYNIGVSAWHVYKKTSTFEYALGYSKIQNKWQLAVRERDVNEPDNDEIWALAQAPRFHRHEALAHLESLVTRIRENAEVLGKQILSRQKYLEGWLDGQEKPVPANGTGGEATPHAGGK